MARPLKKGLGYFPLDTDFLSDRKIRRLVQKYKSEGIATYLAILCEIYGTTGYYVRYSEDFCFDIGFTLNLREERVRAIITLCVETRLFDKRLFEEHGILTSRGIQIRFREIYKRNGIRIAPEWELPAENGNEEAANPPISGAETPVIATETPVSATITLVSAAKTPIKGKGNKKENQTRTFKNHSTHENPIINDNGEASRRAELLQMAADATSPLRHA